MAIPINCLMEQAKQLNGRVFLKVKNTFKKKYTHPQSSEHSAMKICTLSPVLTGCNSSEKTTWNKAFNRLQKESTTPYSIKVAVLHLNKA